MVILAGLAGLASHRALAAGTPPPPCPASGPNHIESAHFTVDYNGDKTNQDYITETQAGDILAAAERAYGTFVGMGYPTPLVNAATGKTGFAVVNLSAAGISSEYCDANVDFDSTDVAADDMPYNVGADVFLEIGLKLIPHVGYPDYWLLQEAGSWASWKALGYPAASTANLGPFEMALDCWDPNLTNACSKDGYTNLGGSRWAFYEYLAERFGQTFMLEAFADADGAHSSMTGLQTALAAHGSSVSTEYAAFATKIMAGGWTASALNVAAPPISGAAVHTGASTGDTAPQIFGIDHLATRYIEIDRGDGDASHACYAATLTIHVTIPAGVTSQPTFYWNGAGSTPVPLTVSGSSATASLPWDTCAWQNKGLLSLPNTSVTANGTNFTVWTHIDVDTTKATTATPPPAPGSTYGQVIDTGSAIAVPDVVVAGPQLLRLAATDTQLHLIVQSSGEGTMTMTLGAFSLGTVPLRPGANDLRIALPKGALARLRTSSATNLLTLTPISMDGRTTGTAVTRGVAFTPAKKAVVKHKKAPAKHKKHTARKK